MKTFLKAQLNSLLSTLADFLLTILLAEVLQVWYLAASILGAVGGALANFCIARYWVFDAREKAVKRQGLRYAMVWIGSVLLNAAGLYGLTEGLGIEYIISKCIVTVAVGIGYNYVLQKNYVFSLK